MLQLVVPRALAPVFVVVTSFVLLGAPSSAFADEPVAEPLLVAPEDGSEYGEYGWPTDWWVEGVEGDFQAQLATDPMFEDVVCDSGWFFGGYNPIFNWDPWNEYLSLGCGGSSGVNYWRVRNREHNDTEESHWSPWSEPNSFTLGVPPEPEEEEEFDTDAWMYSEEHEIPLWEAAERLALQEEIGELNAALAEQESETFGGLWVVHEPTFGAVASFTASGSTTIATYTDNTPLDGLIDAETATYTLAELQTKQQDVQEIIEEIDASAASQIDEENNEVELITTDHVELEEAISEAEEVLPGGVGIREVGDIGTPAASIIGGATLTTCTVGFSVINTYSTKGVTTAGHCSPTQYYQGHQLPHQSEIVNGWDAQWHTTPNYTPKPRVKDGVSWDSTPYYRLIKGRTLWAKQSQGDYVCKYGKLTKFDCGYIKTKHYPPCWIEDAIPQFVVLDSPSPDLLTVEGDSGGPVFVGNRAWGIISGLGNDGQQSIYMPINGLQGLDVGVLID